nr:T9SS type A sorting domain-containing protein [uncultured Carboxylicivirga sp.]
MKKFYLSKFKSLYMATAILLAGSSLKAQDDLTWNGNVSSNYLETQNWTPEGTVDGNNITFGNTSSYTNPCIIDGTSDITVNIMDMFAESTVDENDPNITYPAGVVTINMAPGTTFRVNGNRAPAGDYMKGTLNITGGNYHYNRLKNYYMDSDESIVNLNCETATYRHVVALGNGNTPSAGGRMNIEGSTIVYMNGLIRVPTNIPDKVSISLTDNAQMYINGDLVDYIHTCIDNGNIITSEDMDVVAEYDPNTLKTHVYLRAKDAFIIEPADRQLLVVGEAGSTVSVIENDGYTNMTGGVQWVYGTTDGNYTSEFTGETGTSIDPVFTEAGTFFMALKGTDGTSTIHYSNSVEFQVSSNLVNVSPEVAQNLRLGQTAATLTVTEEQTASTRDWKISTTAGGPYSSFDTPVGTTTCTPEFTEAGMYYIVCVSTINGVAYQSKEIQINVSEWNAAALNITYTGPNNGPAENMLNWDPAAYIHKNAITIPDDINAIINKAGKDTLAGITIGLNGVLTVKGESPTDTIWYRADHNSSPGSFLIEEGVFIKEKGFMRLYDVNTTFTVTGNAKAIFTTDTQYEATVLLSKTNAVNPPDGSNMYIQDNAQILFNTWPGRISGAAEYGNFYLQDNAQYVFSGNAIGYLSIYVNGEEDSEGNITRYPSFIAPQGFEVKMIYDANADETIIYAQDINSLYIANPEEQKIASGQASEPLTLQGAGLYSSFEWVWSEVRDGEYQSFSPAVTGQSGVVSFDEPGTYFVKCIADGSYTTTNFAIVNIVPVAITPGDDQELATNGIGAQLTAVYADGYIPVEWMARLKGDTEYQSFEALIGTPMTGDTYEPYGESFGTHFIVCKFTTPTGETIYSNEVGIWVDEAMSIKPEKEELGMKIYPNPSDGNFYIDVDSKESVTIEVINTAGALVSKKQVTAAGSIPVSLTTKGLYLVKVTSGKTVKVERIIVK